MDSFTIFNRKMALFLNNTKYDDIATKRNLSIASAPLDRKSTKRPDIINLE